MSAIETSLGPGGGHAPGEHPVETIRGVLKTQVVDILWQNLPQVARLPRQAAYDRILDTPALLAECFQLFRRRPELFAPVVMTPERKPVSKDDDLLWCGRSLAEVIALIVRASARRYFRHSLDHGQAAEHVHQHRRPGWLARTARTLGFKAAHHPQPRKSLPSGSKAERLYRAMRDLLLFEWQAPLIPHYAPLAPQVVDQLGPRLLAFRRPEQLKVLADEGLPGGRLPLVLDDARRLLAPDAGLDPEVVWQAIDKLDLARLYPALDRGGVRRAVAHIATIDPKAVAALMPAFGDDLCRFTVFLFVAYQKLGMQRFRQAFGADGQGWTVVRLAERIAKGPAWPDDLEGMRRLAEDFLATAIEAGPAPRPDGSARQSRLPQAVSVRD